MKKSYLICRNLSFLLLSLSGLQACGLRYLPPPTPESIEEDRRMALEQQLSSDYASAGKKYVPLTYGDLEVIKPEPYRKLDSLFAVKYRQENFSGGSTVEIDRLIDYQQAVIQNDTTPVLYVETHWYKLVQDSTYEFLTSEISMRKNNKIVKVKNLDYFAVPKRYSVEAESYMKETSILTPGMTANNDELTFYTAFKNHAATLKGAPKDTFMLHTFQLMELIDESNAIYTESLLKILALKEVRKVNPEASSGNTTVKTEEISDSSTGKALFQFYRVTVTVAGTTEPYVYLYSQYLELIQ